MKIEIGSYEAKTKLPELLRQVKAGKSFTITNRGEAIADLVYLIIYYETLIKLGFHYCFGASTMRQTELRLSAADRKVAEAVRAKGVCSAREVNRAHILLSLDRNVPEAHIMAVLGVGRTAVWRTRAAYRDGGLDLALIDVQRPGRPPKYGTDAEAQVTALACSQVPDGSARWTLARLHEAARKEVGLSKISVATIRRMLKKTVSNPGAK